MSVFGLSPTPITLEKPGPFKMESVLWMMWTMAPPGAQSKLTQDLLVFSLVMMELATGQAALAVQLINFMHYSSL